MSADKDGGAAKCPDCAKARAKYVRLDTSMARRGNFGIVPLPLRCKKHRARADESGKGEAT